MTLHLSVHSAVYVTTLNHCNETNFNIKLKAIQRPSIRTTGTNNGAWIFNYHCELDLPHLTYLPSSDCSRGVYAVQLSLWSLQKSMEYTPPTHEQQVQKNCPSTSGSQMMSEWCYTAILLYHHWVMAGMWTASNNQPGLLHYTLEHSAEMSSVHQFFDLIVSQFCLCCQSPT